MSNSPSISDPADPIVNNINVDMDDDDKQNIFADGVLEEFEEKEITAGIWRDLGSVVYNSKIEPRRRNPIKVVIVRSKREFGAPVTFYDKEPGSEGNNEVKPITNKSNNDYLSVPRGILEIGFQTKHSMDEPIKKSFQVQKIRKVNAFTQVFESNMDIKPIFNNIAAEYLKVDKKDFMNANLKKIEDFITQVRPKVEEALQSNETIDIFQSDFQLDKWDVTEKVETNEKKKQESEVRMFRDNMLAGQKSKKEKCINCIRLLNHANEYIAHSYFRNLSFDERNRLIGIPYTGQILFWNFKDTEINSPVYVLELPMEVTLFEFNPLNINLVVCALFSGQLIIFEFKDLMHILKNGFDSEFNENLSKINKSEIYTFYITSISESHKTHVTGMKWFPAGYTYKNQLIFNKDANEVFLLATLAEDGQVLIWDTRNFDKTSKNEVGNFIKPVLRVEINKVDSLLKICGSALELKIKLLEPSLYVGTDDGQVYYVDWRDRVTQENLTNNVKKVYNICYNRPVISLEISPYYENIFMTVHDFNFCIWSTNYNAKPIIVSPNLKSSFYIGGKFSKSRPAVLFVARNQGQIDIWDFLDESHKPSVKETFLKEVITYIDLILYTPMLDDEILKTRSAKHEYLCLGDQCGQMSIMEIPKLFTEMVNDELRLVSNFFENELKRQQYMDIRYKEIDEEYNKPQDDADTLVGTEKQDKPEETNESTELRYIEDFFLEEKRKLIEEYGFEFAEENLEEE